MGNQSHDFLTTTTVPDFADEAAGVEDVVGTTLAFAGNV
jgi:hypothetical protein